MNANKMKRLNISKTCLLLFVSLPFLCNRPERAEACVFWGGEGDELRFFYFRPDLAGDPAWVPFYYSMHFYYGNAPDEIPNDSIASARDRMRLVDEWQKALGEPSVKAADILGILYETMPDSFLQETKRGEKFFAKNTFVQALQKPQHRALWEYLRTVKESEGYTASDFHWDFRKSKASQLVRERQELIVALQEKLKSTELTPFLRARYAFLALRLLFYAEKGNKAQSMRDLFDRYLAPLPDGDVLRNWGLHYLAQTTSDDAERNYFHALVFDRCNDKKLRSHQLFQSPNAEAALRLARNNHEKTVILTLKELNNPGKSLASIRRVLDWTPGSPYLQLLVSREINKLEDWIFTPEYLNRAGSLHHSLLGRDPYEETNGGYDALPQKWRANDLAYLRELRQTLEQSLPQAGDNLHFLRLAVAHLYLMDHRPNDARPYLADADAPNFVYALQKRLLNLSLTLNTRDVRSPEAQNELAGHLRWLEQNQDSILDGTRTFSLAMAMVAKSYEQKRSAAYTALLYNRGNLRGYFGDYHLPYYARLHYLDTKGSPEAVREVIRLLEKKNKTAFEQLLAEPYRDAWPFYDLLGTMLLREGKTAEANALFRQIPAEFWNTRYQFAIWLDDDPFTRLKHLPSPPSWEQYNKATATNRLLELEKTAETNPAQSAECYRQLGNAWYNFSDYGNSWMMLSYGWSDGGLLPYGWEKSDLVAPYEAFKRQYYLMEKAFEYYQKALKVSQEPEISAHAAFMLAHIDAARHGYKNKGDSWYVGAYAIDYFKRFRETNFYRAYPCETIEDYMRK